MDLSTQQILGQLLEEPSPHLVLSPDGSRERTKQNDQHNFVLGAVGAVGFTLGDVSERFHF